jgi:hypothetical protein
MKLNHKLAGGVAAALVLAGCTFVGYDVGRTQGPGSYPQTILYGSPSPHEGWWPRKIRLEDSPWNPLSNPDAGQAEAVRRLADAGIPAANNWMAGYYAHTDPARALAYEHAAYQASQQQIDAMPRWMPRPELWPVLAR